MSADERPASYEPADDGIVTVRSADRSWLDELGLTSLKGAFAAEPAEERGRYKALARLPHPDGGTVFVKRYDYNRAEVWVRSAVKLNFPVYSGPSEMTNLLALAEAGLRVPVPLAAGEADDGPRRRSFVALQELPGRPLDQLPAPPTPRERRARIAAVAAFARRLHERGYWHKDLYTCNVFFDDGFGLGVIDCERVSWHEDGPAIRWRVKDLAALLYSATWPTRTERLRFLRDYLERERLTKNDKRLGRAIARKAARLARRGAKGP